jgi:hypothetical protein
MSAAPGFLPLPSDTHKSESTKNPTLSGLELTESTIEISEGEYRSILEDHLHDSEYKFKYTLLMDNKQALRENMEELNAAIEEREEATRELKIWKSCEAAVNRNEALHPDDRRVWQKSSEEVQGRVSEVTSLLKTLRSDRIKMEDAQSKNQIALKKHVMASTTSTFVYELRGNFYKVALGAVSLKQPKTKSLDELGLKLREMLTDDKRLRSLNFAEVSKFCQDYANAAGPTHRDFSSLSRVNMELLQNPQMSRYNFIKLATSICDASLGQEVVSRVNRLTKEPDAVRDIANSLDEKLCAQQLVKQKRAPFMDNYQADLQKYAHKMTQEQKELYGYVEQKKPNAYNGRPRSRPNKGKGRANPWNGSKRFNNGGKRQNWGNNGGSNSNGSYKGKTFGGKGSNRNGYRQNPQYNNADSRNQGKQ